MGQTLAADLGDAAAAFPLSPRAAQAMIALGSARRESAAAVAEGRASARENAQRTFAQHLSRSMFPDCTAPAFFSRLSELVHDPNKARGALGANIAACPAALQGAGVETSLVG